MPARSQSETTSTVTTLGHVRLGQVSCGQAGAGGHGGGAAGAGTAGQRTSTGGAVEPLPGRSEAASQAFQSHSADFSMAAAEEGRSGSMLRALGPPFPQPLNPVFKHQSITS